MIFLEMSRDEVHGGGSWAFPRCVWAPTSKADGRSWPFWSKILTVEPGDTIIHLRGSPPSARFVGYSTAASFGYRTEDRPPQRGEWDHATSFYRADLEAFTSFETPINLAEIFSTNRQTLEQYFDRNRGLGAAKQQIFFVRQSGRLQCLNGAYFSVIDGELFDALFNRKISSAGFEDAISPISVVTGQQLAVVQSRIGQDVFAKEIKRIYGNRCCFPTCSVADTRFLVGSHIARWSDNAEFRGHLGNGLCLCLMHDKAFEIGLFTLNDQLEAVVDPAIFVQDPVLAADLRAAHGKQIRPSSVPPLAQAVAEHRHRIHSRQQQVKAVT